MTRAKAIMAKALQTAGAEKKQPTRLLMATQPGRKQVVMQVVAPDNIRASISFNRAQMVEFIRMAQVHLDGLEQ